MGIKINDITQGDCVKLLEGLDEPIADLIFADPPFNIGYKYDVYEDRKAYDEYHAWTERWMRACVERALKRTGSMWVAIGDEYAAEVKLIGDKLGLHLRNWVIWHYTFGQNTRKKFARSHAHLFYWVRDPAAFTFNDKAVRVFSDRQREYHDRRASRAGKIPDDSWWEFPRVCGTFDERVQFHPCQMPESVLSRIIRASSSCGDVVFDPFAGSGTTLAAAKRLGRDWAGTELSAEYVRGARRRLQEVEPLAATGAPAWTEPHVRELQWLYAEAGVRTDLLYEHPHLLESFTDMFNWRLANAGVDDRYGPQDVWDRLETLRKEARLARIRVHAAEPTTGPPRTLREPLFATIRAER
ncbi:MAG: site-specific DNA-methyltransferase [Phycisphaerae bacterium]|nr:site-specific DNA-methyltransferase [Phycisphaerae bacterium]